LQTVCVEPAQKIMVEGTSADPAANKTDDGRTLPVAKFCRRRRCVANGKQGKHANDTLFMIGDYEDDEACDFRLYQMLAEIIFVI
jgi:type IV secretory pathway protease TraF